MITNTGAELNRIRETQNQEEELDLKQLLEESGKFVFGTESYDLDNTKVSITATALGKGNHSEGVYRGEFIQLKLPISVKKVPIFQPERVNQANRNDEIKNETRQLKRTDHPNIVDYYGFYALNKVCHICTELMYANVEEVAAVAHATEPKLNITEKFPRKKIQDFVGCVTVSVVDALAYLRNQAKIIHGDLKPNNILINEEGLIKLCDFGVSKKLITGISNTGTVADGTGCVAYIAPERFDKRDGVSSSKSEMWALGVTLFEIATGMHPFGGKSCVRAKEVHDVLMQDPYYKTTSNYREYLRHGIDISSFPPRFERIKDGREEFSVDLRTFVNTCVSVDSNSRFSVNENDKRCAKTRAFYKMYANDGEKRKTIVKNIVNEITADRLQILRTRDNQR